MSKHFPDNWVHMVGFGSQAQAWAQALRGSGWQVRAYLSRPQGPSAARARELGFDPMPLTGFPADLSLGLAGAAPEDPAPRLVAMLCPDSVIASVYREFLAPLPVPLTLVLGHGYAVYSGELRPARADHELALLAPKAIGPKLWQLYQEARAQDGGKEAHHRLVAAFRASPERAEAVLGLARAMGFAPQNLVDATFEQEAMGDLISEQGLLCGGVFTLLEWTLEAMTRAGIPTRLIREECLTELELIAGLLRERGPASTFRSISQAAQCGTVEMAAQFRASNLRAYFDDQVNQVLDRRFAERFRSASWKRNASDLAQRLQNWEKELAHEYGQSKPKQTDHGTLGARPEESSQAHHADGLRLPDGKNPG